MPGPYLADGRPPFIDSRREVGGGRPDTEARPPVPRHRHGQHRFSRRTADLSFKVKLNGWVSMTEVQHHHATNPPPTPRPSARDGTAILLLFFSALLRPKPLHRRRLQTRQRRASHMVHHRYIGLTHFPIPPLPPPLHICNTCWAEQRGGGMQHPGHQIGPSEEEPPPEASL